MKKSFAFKDVKVSKYYLIKQPVNRSQLTDDDLDDSSDYGWREKARRLQARRWRKIKHQLA
jgi:hypothetical protein